MEALGLPPTARDLGLTGRVALVTRASKGLGLGIARALAGDGVRVAVSSRSRERIESAAGEIGAHAYVHDSNDLDGAPGLVESVEGDLGPLHVLVTKTGGPPLGFDSLGFSREQVPAGRLGTVDEFGAVAAFLYAKPAGYVSGTALLVDGGLTQSI